MRTNLLIVALAMGIALVSAVVEGDRGVTAFDRKAVLDDVQVAVPAYVPPKNINLRPPRY